MSLYRTVVKPGHDSACAMQHLSLEDPPRIVGGGRGRDPGRDIEFRHGTQNSARITEQSTGAGVV